MPLVPKVASNPTEMEIALALRDGHVGAFGTPPSLDRLAIAWGQVCQETARGKALCGWNMANLTCKQGSLHDYYTRTGTEYLQGDGKGAATKTLCFRSFPSATVGAIAYWRSLADGYPEALALFDTGDGEAVAKALAKRHYFTAPIADYARALRLLSAEFKKRFSARFASCPPPPPSPRSGVVVMPPLEVRGRIPGAGNDGGGENA
jgi:hypothetical protein